MLGTPTEVFPLAMCWTLIILYTPKWHLSCSPHRHCLFVLTNSSTVFLSFYWASCCWPLGSCLFLQILKFIQLFWEFSTLSRAFFSSSPVPKNICIPSPFHIICKFNKHTVYSIIHSINKNAGKTRYRFRINLHIELLVMSSIWTGSLYKYSLNIDLWSSWCLYFAPVLACWSR